MQLVFECSNRRMACRRPLDNPTLISDTPRLASSNATRMSHEAASVGPTPSAGPFMARIADLRHSTIEWQHSLWCRMCRHATPEASVRSAFAVRSAGGKATPKAGQHDHSYIVSSARLIHIGHHVYMELTFLRIHGRVVNCHCGDVVDNRDIDLCSGHGNAFLEICASWAL